MIIVDNNKNGSLFDALKTVMTNASELSVLSSEFSVFAFDALSEALEGIERTKLLLSPSTQTPFSIPSSQELLGGEEEHRQALTHYRELASLKATIRKETEFARKVEPNTQIKAREAQLQQAVTAL
jgi:hypothetical protein